MQAGAQVANSVSRGAVRTPRPTNSDEVGRGVLRAPSRRTTERASRMRTRAAQVAVKRLRANGSQAAGSKANGYRTAQVSGWRSSGCQVQPETRAIAPMLVSEAQ